MLHYERLLRGYAGGLVRGAGYHCYGQGFTVEAQLPAGLWLVLRSGLLQPHNLHQVTLTSFLDLVLSLCKLLGQFLIHVFNLLESPSIFPFGARNRLGSILAHKIKIYFLKIIKPLKELQIE